jgi:hypothetical protein
MADLCLDILKSPNFFPEWLHQLAFATAMYWGSFSPISLLTHVVGGVFDDGYSNRVEVESQCGFDLHILHS